MNLSDPKHPASRPDPKVQYIWDLAADSHGNLYAATGPNGQLWKRSADGKWSLVYESKATHLLCLAIGPDGSVYAGGDGEGLIYRVSPDGKATILFDAPQAEVRTLLWAGDGALYAGTAAEAGGATSTRSSLFLTRAGGTEQVPGRSRRRPRSGIALARRRPRPAATGRVSVAEASAVAQAKAGGPRPPQGGSAAPRPISPGDNAVYRLDADGVPREVLRVKALVHALAWADDRLLVGTGPDGQLYEVRDRGDETVPWPSSTDGQILSLLSQPDGTIAIGTGDPGSVVRLAPGYAATGSLMSEVHDTKLVSRFGALSWRCDLPPGTSIAFQARTGNVGEPDETWSAWSAEQTDPRPGRDRLAAGSVRPVSGQAHHDRPAANARAALGFAQLSHGQPGAGNHPARRPRPEHADGAARQTRLNLRWDATDPNDDELNFTLDGPQGRLARLDRAHRAADHREDVRLGHDRVSVGTLPSQAHRQRSTVEQPEEPCRATARV